MSTGYATNGGDDYTTRDETGFDPDAYQMAGVTAARDAEQIESDRAFNPPPPGDHEFIVKGFAGKPKVATRQVYYNGQSWQYNTDQIGVRMVLASDPSKSITDYFDLPPRDAGDQTLYLYGSKNADGKNAGFHADKLGHFLARLGFPLVKGQPWPAQALSLGAWIGRHIVATVELQQQKDKEGNVKYDATTGDPLPPRAQLKLFSYRPSQATLNGPVIGAAPAQPHPAPAQPAPRPVPPPPPVQAAQPMMQPQPQPMMQPQAAPAPQPAPRRFDPNQLAQAL